MQPNDFLSENVSRSFPVDAVFTWVDGSDPAWLAKKSLLCKDLKGASLSADADNPSRFQENDELRYALRALCLYAPWIRKVHLITDDQKPAWLDTSEVNMVSHTDIFPPEVPRPVFSCRPIEFCIHKISGLAEHFLYFNDDFMLGRTVEPQDFFLPDGRPLVWAAKRSRCYMDRLRGKENAGVSHTAAVARAHRLVLERFGKSWPYTLRHFPKPMTRSTAEALWQSFPAEVASTLSSPLRSPSDVSVTMLYPLYLLATEQGKARVINGARQLVDFFTGRMAHVGASLGDANMRRKMLSILLLRPLTYCLNDASGATDADRAELRRFLKKLLPHPCRFELQNHESATP